MGKMFMGGKSLCQIQRIGVPTIRQEILLVETRRIKVVIAAIMASWDTICLRNVTTVANRTRSTINLRVVAENYPGDRLGNQTHFERRAVVHLITRSNRSGLKEDSMVVAGREHRKRRPAIL